jgi:hypothetical protein
MNKKPLSQMEKEDIQSKIEHDRYYEKRQELKMKGVPLLTMSKEHIITFSKLSNKSKQPNVSIDEIITELTIAYKELYEDNRFHFGDDVYFAMAVFTAYNVEDIPENKKYADMKIKEYMDEKKEEERLYEQFKETILDNGKDEMDNQ